MIWPVYEFRPSPGQISGDVRRYAGGKWVEDDGDYDVCFINHSVSLYFEPPFQRNIICSWLTTHWTGNLVEHPRGGNPWHYALRDGTSEWGGDWGRDRHENVLAGRAGMSEVCRLHHCANGRHVEMRPADKVIAAGLLRNRDTKEVFRFHGGMTCMYCQASAPISCVAVHGSPQDGKEARQDG